MNSNYKQQWENCLRVIRDNISEEQYKAWFEPVTAVGFEEGILTLKVPTEYFCEQYENTFFDLIIRVLKKEIPGIRNILYKYNVI